MSALALFFSFTTIDLLQSMRLLTLTHYNSSTESQACKGLSTTSLRRCCKNLRTLAIEKLLSNWNCMPPELAGSRLGRETCGSASDFERISQGMGNYATMHQMPSVRVVEFRPGCPGIRCGVQSSQAWSSFLTSGLSLLPVV